jgi:hypothetical protein
MGALRIAALILVLMVTAAKADGTTWTSRDYVDLFFRHYNGHVPLPHLREPTQKALFHHLVDPRNITGILDAPVSRDEKRRQLEIILALLGAYRADYNMAVIVGEPLEQELTLVQAYSLEVTAALARLMGEEQSAGRAASAWTTLVEGVIVSIGESTRYTPAQSAAMADAITLHYPAISAVLPEADRRRLRERAASLSAEGRGDYLHAAIARMQQVLTKQ